MKFLIEDIENEQVVIAFKNSSGELEYSIFELVDGGTTEVSSTTSTEDAIRELLADNGLEPELDIQEIED